MEQQKLQNAYVLTPEVFLRDTYFNIVSSFCKVDMDIFQQNTDLFESWKDSERKLSLSMATFISKYFTCMTVCLALDYSGCKALFADALNKEMKIDRLSDDKRIEARRKMEVGIFSEDYSIDIGISIFSQEVLSALLGYLNEGNAVLGNNVLAKRFDEALSGDVSGFLSVVFSNYAYLFRAFICDGVFVSKVISLLSDFVKEFDIDIP